MTSDIFFKDFVERQQRPASADNALDWNRERDDWLDLLRQLYGLVAKYLDPYIRSGAITLRESAIELNEENIGFYTAKRLTVLIGAQEILFTPIGTLLVGSKGRVDVEGSAGNSRLVLVDRTIGNPREWGRVATAAHANRYSTSPAHIDWAWKIVGRPPAMHFAELNKETLFEMLMEVSNG